VYEALYVLALTTGPRQGELLSLKWVDVDLQAGHLQVRASVRKVKGLFHFFEPKTAQSRRRVALTTVALAALREHRMRQAEQRRAAGVEWQENDLVFPDTLGTPLSDITLLRRYVASSCRC
jgi:integrase